MWPPIKPVIAAVLTMLSAAAARADVKVGEAFPSLAAAGLTGGVLPPTAAQVMLVDFWASWCGPCKESFPVYAGLQADYAARGFVIVAVSEDEKPRDYEAFLRKLKPPFATVLDPGHALVSQVNAPTTPTSYLLDRDGKVRFLHEGFHGADSARELRKEIETLLAERK